MVEIEDVTIFLSLVRTIDGDGLTYWLPVPLGARASPFHRSVIFQHALENVAYMPIPDVSLPTGPDCDFDNWTEAPTKEGGPIFAPSRRNYDPTDTLAPIRTPFALNLVMDFLHSISLQHSQIIKLNAAHHQRDISMMLAKKNSTNDDSQALLAKIKQLETSIENKKTIIQTKESLLKECRELHITSKKLIDTMDESIKDLRAQLATKTDRPAQSLVDNHSSTTTPFLATNDAQDTESGGVATLKLQVDRLTKSEAHLRNKIFNLERDRSSKQTDRPTRNGPNVNHSPAPKTDDHQRYSRRGRQQSPQFKRTHSSMERNDSRAPANRQRQTPESPRYSSTTAAPRYFAAGSATPAPTANGPPTTNQGIPSGPTYKELMEKLEHISSNISYHSSGTSNNHPERTADQRLLDQLTASTISMQQQLTELSKNKAPVFNVPPPPLPQNVKWGSW